MPGIEIFLKHGPLGILALFMVLYFWDRRTIYTKTIPRIFEIHERRLDALRADFKHSLELILNQIGLKLNTIDEHIRSIQDELRMTRETREKRPKDEDM